MKKFALYTFLCIALASCSIHRIYSEPLVYSEGVEYQIEGIVTHKFFESGQGANSTVHFAGKEGRFKRLQIVVKNNTKEIQPLNLTDFELLDENDNHYQPCYVMQTLKINDNINVLERKIKPGKKKTFIIQYCETFPKDDVPKLKVKNVLIPLPEKK